jgi:endonuclease YncB( thermonuclease family)
LIAEIKRACIPSSIPTSFFLFDLSMDRQRSSGCRRTFVFPYSLALLITGAVFVILPLAVCGTVFADFSGRLVAVLDGDRLQIAKADSEQGVVLRLGGIDAPEEGQPFWQEAKTFLDRLLAGKPFRVTVRRPLLQDTGGLSVGNIVLPDGSTANRALITAGLAWADEEEFQDDDAGMQELKVLEAEARKARRGLWADPEPVPPWLYRRLRSGAYP